MNLYMHTGSLNHGCEAIVRSTYELSGREETVLYSYEPKEDYAVGLDKELTIKKTGPRESKKNPGYVIAKALSLIFGEDIKYKYLYGRIIKEAKGGTYVSVGGDNYCYKMTGNLAYINRKLKEKGCKTVLWGCSIDEDTVKNPCVREDLLKYDLITARESITYENLVKNGIEKNTYLFPDPAFTLKAKEIVLPEFFDKKVVGVNISPIVYDFDKNYGTCVMENYRRLVKYIVEETDMNVMILPHVCEAASDDRWAGDALYEEFKETGRIFKENSEGTMSCTELKYLISKCEYMVAARTHASVAAYSTMVPTFVLGYSVKSIGIAKDIFGTDTGFVCDTYKMLEPDELTKYFKNLCKNGTSIRERLKEVMPDYIKKAYEAGNVLKERL